MSMIWLVRNRRSGRDHIREMHYRRSRDECPSGNEMVERTQQRYLLLVTQKLADPLKSESGAAIEGDAADHAVNNIESGIGGSRRGPPFTPIRSPSPPKIPPPTSSAATSASTSAAASPKRSINSIPIAGITFAAITVRGGSPTSAPCAAHERAWHGRAGIGSNDFSGRSDGVDAQHPNGGDREDGRAWQEKPGDLRSCNPFSNRRARLHFPVLRPRSPALSFWFLALIRRPGRRKRNRTGPLSPSHFFPRSRKESSEPRLNGGGSFVEIRALNQKTRSESTRAKISGR